MSRTYRLRRHFTGKQKCQEGRFTLVRAINDEYNAFLIVHAIMNVPCLYNVDDKVLKYEINKDILYTESNAPDHWACFNNYHNGLGAGRSYRFYWRSREELLDIKLLPDAPVNLYWNDKIHVARRSHHGRGGGCRCKRCNKGERLESKKELVKAVREYYKDTLCHPE